MQTQEIFYSLLSTPVGFLGLVGNGAGLLEIILQSERPAAESLITRFHPGAGYCEEMEAKAQLQAYFEGKLQCFRLPLNLSGMPPFSRRVLECLALVPFGSTVTYGELARLAGNPGAARAVGRTMSINRFPIVLPCHRVVGAGGAMTGYSGGEGIATKRWLLDFERMVLHSIDKGSGKSNFAPKSP